MRTATITQINIYPVKSCAGIAVARSSLGPRGLTGDRNWMIVNRSGRFLTQREMPRLALIKPGIDGPNLHLSAPDMPALPLDAAASGNSVQVAIWDHHCAAIDAGDAAARWVSDFLRAELRLVRFDASTPRLSDSKWTGEVAAENAFSDGFPLLLISEASLADLNARLKMPLPMNRFRPNIVIGGVAAYAEDRIAEFIAASLRLRVVKPCTRCAITTVEQTRGEFTGTEPLRTLKSYRWNRELRGVAFGQNIIALSGIGSELYVGQELGIG